MDIQVKQRKLQNQLNEIKTLRREFKDFMKYYDEYNKRLSMSRMLEKGFVKSYQDQIQSALRTYQLASQFPIGDYLKSINKAVATVNLYKKLQNNVGAFERLNRHLSFVGSYELNLYEDEIETEQAIKEEAPPSIIKKLDTVEWLPIRLLNRLSHDPSIIRNISHRNFEELTACIVDKLGFKNVLLTKASHDGGRDVIATKHISGIPLLFAFECKYYKESNKIGVEIMRSLLGSVAAKNTQTNIGVLVTTSTFTKDAQNFILSESRIDGKDYNDIFNWINDIKYKI